MIETILEALASFIESYAANAPWLVNLIIIMGTFRLIVKPIVTAIEEIVKATPSRKDDEQLDKIKASPAWYWFFFILDWFTSIKIPSIFRKKK